MELYFWLILGAILLVSLTILLARPNRKQTLSEQYGSLLEGTSREEVSNHDRVDNESEMQKDFVEEEKKPEVIIAEAKKKWALSFAVFGLVFNMMGGIVLFIFNYEFTTFLGSCMIYIGIMSLVKGISFQIPDKRVLVNGLIPIIIFLLNFLLLDSLLGVISQSAWMLLSVSRKIGDFTLVYILPYMMWKLVPTFNLEIEENSSHKSKGFLEGVFIGALKFVIFTFILFLITDLLHAPTLRQYAKVGFNISLPILCITLITYVISGFVRRSNTKIIEDKEI